MGKYNDDFFAFFDRFVEKPDKTIIKYSVAALLFYIAFWAIVIAIVVGFCLLVGII